MTPPRYLLITADDFGIGPSTNRGILELASLGLVTSTVLLVNSPYAEDGVERWKQSGSKLELGWHPCLTLDGPVSPVGQIPSLVDAEGKFFPLGKFVKRLVLGRVKRGEIRIELTAQYQRFRELVGIEPFNINGHHHIHQFRKVGKVLIDVMKDLNPKPFLRRGWEFRSTLERVPGVRKKRWVLRTLGAIAAKRQRKAGFPGNDELLGITDPQFVSDPDFFPRWLHHSRGRFAELMVHPGYFDETISGRDGSVADGQLQRRAVELVRLKDPCFREAVNAAGFELVTAQGMVEVLENR